MDTDLSFKDYLSMLKRRWKLLVITVVGMIVASVTMALIMPPVYESKGTILIESQQIPTDLMKINVDQFADERIEAIKQRVMTRENLYKLIETYGLYFAKKNQLTVTEMVDDLRNKITITTLSANKGGKGGAQATIAFSVNYENSKPDLAFKVANEIVTLFLSENARDRTTNATETTEFFEKESVRLRTDLEEIEKKVAEFKQTNANSLPEYKDMNLAMIQRIDTSIQDIDREIKTSQEELRYLDIELAAAKAGIGSKNTNQQPSAPDELAKVKEEYANLSATYTENHPTLKKLKSKIEALEKVLKDKPADVTLAAATTKEEIEAKLRVEKVEAQISSAKIRLDSLNTQKQKLFGELTSLQQKVLLSPQVERELTSLLRDYDNAKAKYDEIKSKQINSKMTVSLEQENKGERFVLIDPPSLPEKPTKPNRQKIIALGVLLSIFAGLLAVYLIESLDARVRSEEQLTEIIGYEPLVVIPYIKTYDEILSGKKYLKLFVLIFVILLLVSAIVVHFLIMPLDVVMITVANKLK